MYTLTRNVRGSTLVKEQLPAFAGALVIAETLYEFHSFALECIAFLATWFVLDWTVTKVLNWRR